MSARSLTNERTRFILILSILLIYSLSGAFLIVAPAQAMPPDPPATETTTVEVVNPYFSISAVDNPVPTITTLSPPSVFAGGIGFSLTVYGTNFVSTSVVRWNGADRATTYVSSTQLTASISAADIVSTGIVIVTVFNPAPGGGTSIGTALAITNPVPTITDLSPNSRTAGSGAFTLTVNGSNYLSTSVVRWNGADRTTTYISGIQLTASISAADIASAGTATVTVFNPSPGGGTSNSVTLTINNPVPTISNINPNTRTAGSGSFTLTVNGTNYVSGSLVRWNGSDRTTTYMSPTQLSATIIASDVTLGGNATVTVFNPTPGGGTSNGVTLTINNPVPAITNLSPGTRAAGSGSFTLTVNGTNFVSGSVVRWNGADRNTTFISVAQLTAAITAADIVSPGNATVTVFNPAPGGGTSNGVTFSITLSPIYIFLPLVKQPAPPNHAPTDLQLSNNSIPEGQPSGTLVGTLSSVDPDAGNTFTYSLVPGSGDTDNSSFYILVNQLRTLAVFDYDVQDSYSIRLRTTDQGGLFYEKAFLITITPVLPPTLQNGDFEQGHVAWYESSTYSPKLIMQYGVDSIPYPPYDGNWAVWLGGYPSDLSYIQQHVTVPADSPYLSFWYWISSTDYCGHDYGRARVNGFDIDTINLCSSNNTNGWVKRVVNLSAYTGTTVTLQIRSETDSVLNSNFFIDHVAFQTSP